MDKTDSTMKEWVEEVIRGLRLCELDINQVLLIDAYGAYINGASAEMYVEYLVNFKDLDKRIYNG